MASINVFWPPSGGGSSSNASVGSNGITAPTSSTEVAGVNPSGNLQPLQTNASGSLITTPDPTGQQHVIVDSSALPSGASTSALQTSGNASLTTIATNSGTQATAANQTTGNTSLATIATNTTGVATAANQTNGTQVTQITGTLPLASGAATSANQSTEITALQAIQASVANVPPLGQTVSASSQPVVLASDYKGNTLNDTQATGTLGALNATVGTSTITGYSVATFTLSGTITGKITPQVLLADGVTWTAVNCYTVPGNVVTLAAAGITNPTGVLTYAANIAGFRGFRLQVTTYTSGSVTAYVNLSSAQGYINAVSPTGNSFQTLAILQSSINLIGYVGAQPLVPVSDVASAAITTTTTTSAFSPVGGSSYSINIPVTAVSGTSPTLSVSIQESADGGTNWYTVYTFPTITTTGSYNSPYITQTGNSVRYVQTIAGTTPSFTRAINRLQSSQPNVINPNGTIFTDNSGTTSATPSTSTQIAAYNQVRRYLFIQNLSSSATIYINFTSAANVGAGSIAILPYGSYVMEASTVTNEPVNVISTTASVPFTCKQG